MGPLARWLLAFVLITVATDTKASAKCGRQGEPREFSSWAVDMDPRSILEKAMTGPDLEDLLHKKGSVYFKNK